MVLGSTCPPHLMVMGMSLGSSDLFSSFSSSFIIGLRNFLLTQIINFALQGSDEGFYDRNFSCKTETKGSTTGPSAVSTMGLPHTCVLLERDQKFLSMCWKYPLRTRCVCSTCYKHSENVSEMSCVVMLVYFLLDPQEFILLLLCFSVLKLHVWFLTAYHYKKR